MASSPFNNNSAQPFKGNNTTLSLKSNDTAAVSHFHPAARRGIFVLIKKRLKNQCTFPWKEAIHVPICINRSLTVESCCQLTVTKTVPVCTDTWHTGDTQHLKRFIVYLPQTRDILSLERVLCSDSGRITSRFDSKETRFDCWHEGC